VASVEIGQTMENAHDFIWNQCSNCPKGGGGRNFSVGGD